MRVPCTMQGSHIISDDVHVHHVKVTRKCRNQRAMDIEKNIEEATSYSGNKIFSSSYALRPFHFISFHTSEISSE